jgi:hypothetical protein
MSIASASKWPFAAYVVEKYRSSPNFLSYIPYLDFTSGYSLFDNSKCNGSQTVAECNSAGNNGTNPLDADPSHPGQYLFHYEGGHMQQLATASPGAGGLGLGNDSATDLAQEVNSGLSGTNFSYAVAQPAGGIVTSATEYAAFLRRLMPGSAQPLALATMLDSYSQCTHSQTCPSTVSTASESNLIPENFHYGLGHWIEDDSTTDAGIKAWSSAGAHGFYPWISNTSPAWYGILARSLQLGETDGTGAGYDSLKCGRAIRAAWITGTQQPNGDPS